MGNPLKYSKPCNGCIKAIEKSGIRRVYYSSNIEFEKMMIERFGFTYGNYNSDSDISTSSISS
jgi:deoxycytidylate deaminase